MYQQTNSRNLFTGIDSVLLISWLLIVGFGILNLYSVDESAGFKQLIWAGLAFVVVLAIFLLNSINQNIFELYSPVLYGLSIILLAGLFIFGKEINGAKAWYVFSGFSFQPAELAKYATSLLLAAILAQPSIDLSNFRSMLIICGIIALPAVLILAQPDLGSVIIFFAFFLALNREGLPSWIIALPIFVGLIFILSVAFAPWQVLFGFLLLSSTLSLLLYLFYHPLKIENRLQRFFSGLNLTLFFGWILLGVILYEKSFEENKISIGLSVILALVSLWLTSKLYQNMKNNPRTSNSGFGGKSDKLLQQTMLTSLVMILFLSVIGVFSYFSPKIVEKLPKHQQERIMVLIEGEKKYKDTSGYNLLYSKTAIGSGQLIGKGWNNGTVKKGRFVPEQQTDYIFCTVGEEWGFLGSVGLILTYFIFICRLFYLSETQKSTFNRFFGNAVASILSIHVVLNISMVLGVFPTVGIPLPFFSYGGTSFLIFSTMVGTFLVLNYVDKRSL